MAKLIEVWKCSICKGTNVQIKQWVNPNTNEVDNTGDIEMEDCWCQDCGEHTDLNLVKMRQKKVTS